MRTKEIIKSIDPKKEYNLFEIEKAGFFFWVKTSRSCRKIVKKDFFGENILKAEISGEGEGTAYKIKGSHIIKFLEKYGEAMKFASRSKIH